MLYITNLFSMNMLREPCRSLTLDICPLDDRQTAAVVRAALDDGGVCTSIGNDAIADAFMDRMLDFDVAPPDPERVRIAATDADHFLWLTYEGPRIQNDVIPAAGKLTYYLVQLNGQTTK